MLEDCLSWASFGDMGLAALIVFALLTRLRGVKSTVVVVGLAVLALAYAGARSAGFLLTANLLLALLVSGLFFAGILCHDDVRRWLDRTSARLFGRRETDEETPAAQVLVEAATQMAQAGVGALVVLPGDQDIEPEVHGGVSLDGELTVPLLRSLFDPGSPGHDGAVIVRGGRVAAFAVHLPLCEDVDLLRGRGTRHAAALGLSQRTDALCVVVSEERSEISIADLGTLRSVDAKGLLRAIRAHGGATRAMPLPRPGQSYGLRAVQGVLALGVAVVGWFAVVAGGEHSTRRFEVAVELENLPESIEVEAVHPEHLEVELAGPLRALLLTNDQDVHVALDGRASAAGRRNFAVRAEDVHPPDGLETVAVRPRVVHLEVGSPAKPAREAR